MLAKANAELAKLRNELAKTKQGLEQANKDKNAALGRADELLAKVYDMLERQFGSHTINQNQYRAFKEEFTTVVEGTAIKIEDDPATEV